MFRYFARIKNPRTIIFLIASRCDQYCHCPNDHYLNTLCHIRLATDYRGSQLMSLLYLKIILLLSTSHSILQITPNLSLSLSFDASSALKMVETSINDNRATFYLYIPVLYQTILKEFFSMKVIIKITIKHYLIFFAEHRF